MYSVLSANSEITMTHVVLHKENKIRPRYGKVKKQVTRFSARDQLIVAYHLLLMIII